MDTKNIIFAIVLSTLVLVVWATFFEPPPINGDLETKKNQNLIKKNDTTSSPSIEKVTPSSKILRSEAIANVKRINLENQNIKGSISLEGAIIDDITFKNYNISLNSEEKVIFLNPKNSEQGYYIGTGWTSTDKENLDLPLENTLWKIKGNKNLTPNNPVLLEWKNNQGLIFTKKIELDNKFLFTVTQTVKNTSNKAYQFYPYAQITRNYKPKVTPIYILHEGFIGMFDEELKEEDYDDIDKEKFTKSSTKGWLGITDKYWLTAIVPEKGKKFQSEFVNTNGKYKANFIITEPKILNPNSSINNVVNSFVAAKEVEVIDAYAEALAIEKFDLAIDWGWFYFITKPLFFVIRYLLKILLLYLYIFLLHLYTNLKYLLYGMKKKNLAFL